MVVEASARATWLGARAVPRRSNPATDMANAAKKPRAVARVTWTMVAAWEASMGSSLTLVCVASVSSRVPAAA
jgi:hypothetical protein